jgi:cell division control protein 12
LDIQAMKQIGSRCNLIPIIAKADTFSPRDLQEYKDRIRQTLQINQIQVYSPAVDHNDPIDSKIGSEILVIT